MYVHQKAIYGADNRSMHREVQGRGRGGGLSQKVHHNKQIDSPSHPSNKVVRFQKS